MLFRSRELAKRLNITHPLLFRYFASKNALIERVYQEVFIGRWNPYWEIVISNRNVPLQERLVNVYQALAQTVLNYDWVRLFMRSEEHTSELQSLMRTSYAVFCLKKNTFTLVSIIDLNSLLIHT